MENIKKFALFEARSGFYTQKVAAFLRDKGEKVKFVQEPDDQEDGLIELSDEPNISVNVTLGNTVYITTEHKDGFSMKDETSDLEKMYKDLKAAKSDKTKGKYVSKTKKPEEKPWEVMDSVIDKGFIVYDNGGNTMKIKNRSNGKSIIVGLYAFKEVIKALHDLLD